MHKRIFIFSLLFLLLASAFDSARVAYLQNANTFVLYDATSGGLPSSSLMAFTAFPPDAASQLYTENMTVMDSTLSGTDAFGGWISTQATIPGFPILDRSAGVQVNFTLQLEKEMHTNRNRAGFSVIILDQEARGVELAFWQDEIWAQHDDRTGALFTHGEGVAFATTALTEYQLTFVGDTYTLLANAQPILTGPVRDYSAFEGFPDPYQTPNFLFFGDDSTTAQARVRLSYISVTGNEPLVPTVALTSTSPSTALPSASPTFPTSPTLAPTSTPVPSGRVPTFCPSGWLIGLAAVVNLMICKRIQQRCVRDF